MAIKVRIDNGTCRLCGDDAGSFVDNANSFFEALNARGLSPATIRAYAYDLVIAFRWMADQERQLDELDQAILLEFITWQKQRGAKPRSINRRLSTCTLLYHFVTGKQPPAGRGASGTAPHYKGRGRERSLGLHWMRKRRTTRLRVKLEHRLVEPLDVNQVGAFLRTLKRYRDLAIVYLMILCGLRSAEVLSLRMVDVDNATARLRILGKGNRERMMPLPAVLVAVIADYLRLERPSNATTDRLLLVLQGPRRGQPMTRAGLRSLFRHRRAVTKDINNANAHRFRHTFGADMARAGVRLPILQRMMGHADSKTTLQYINLSMDDVADEYARAVAAIEKRYDQNR